MARIVEKDFGWNRIFREIKKMERKPFVKIGLQSNTQNKPKKFSTTKDGEKVEKTSEKTNVLEVGVFNEFGTSKIPQRSFIRTTHDQKIGKWKQIIDRTVDNIYLGNTTVKRGLGIVGLQATSDIKLKIKSGDPSWPPNTEATIRRKKSSKPLIDTSQMVNSIRHKVVMSKSGELV